MRKRERKRTHRHHVATLDLIWSGRWVHDGLMVFRWMGFAIFMWMCSLTFLVSEHNPFFWFALQKKSRRSVGGFDAVSMLQKRKRSRWFEVWPMRVVVERAFRQRRARRQGAWPPDLGLLQVGLLGSTCLGWVFLSLRFFFFFCLDLLYCIFGLIWYFDALGFDDFTGLKKIVILRFLISGFVFLLFLFKTYLDLNLCDFWFLILF